MHTKYIFYTFSQCEPRFCGMSQSYRDKIESQLFRDLWMIVNEEKCKTGWNVSYNKFIGTKSNWVSST